MTPNVEAKIREMLQACAQDGVATVVWAGKDGEKPFYGRIVPDGTAEGPALIEFRSIVAVVETVLGFPPVDQPSAGFKDGYLYVGQPARACTQLMESMESHKCSPRDFSIRDLFESLVDDGQALIHHFSSRRKGGVDGSVVLLEANGAVDLSAFNNITDQIIFAEIKQALENPEFALVEADTPAAVRRPDQE